ncbi:TonB-dependent receptor [Christiangramia aquimixticola]|uniref:TonB-dependent receptor n=1 Tax=Christiangramia aquimixticola TaxID=1697558 RepID=UPI003AA968DF
MKISIFWVCLLTFITFSFNAQTPVVTGRIVDAITNVPLPQVKIATEGSFTEVFTNPEGYFSLEATNFASSEIILQLSHPNFLSKRLAIKITSESKDLGIIVLQPDPFYEKAAQNSISLTDAEILQEEAEFDNISGLLQASKDPYLNAAAFDFGQTFYRVRGLGAENAKLLINGIEMNKLYDGRPQWSNWGGLNDVQRNQELSPGISPDDYDFGGLGGTTNILMRASKYPNNGRLTLSGSNRSYTGRIMATYASGELSGGWFYAFSTGRRYSEEGYIEGTVFSANSFFVAIEKQLNPAHSLNLAAIYTPVTRGRSAPLTSEVLNLKGATYNPYWGYQNGKIRNSRMREVKEPIVMLNHIWILNSEIEINSGLSFQFGEVANSRIDYGGMNIADANGQEFFYGAGSNPDPVYYQKLPSYFLRFEGDENFEKAYRARQDILTNGQLNWSGLYEGNILGVDGNAIYALAEDVNRDRLLHGNSVLNWTPHDHLKLIGGVKFAKLSGENFARIKDLFGADRFLDVDIFSNSAQSDLRNLNRTVAESETYKYNYIVDSESWEGFSQLLFRKDKLELSLAGKIGAVSFQRTGNYQNGTYPGNSYGEGEQSNFREYGVKGGVLYKLSGKQNFQFNAAVLTNPPAYKNVFLNPRVNNLLVPEIDEEQIFTSDLSYRYRTSKFNTRLSLFYSEIKKITEVSYYYTDGLSGLGRENTRAFVQEILTDVDKQYMGLEFGAEYQVTSTIKLKAAAGLGEYIYSNNPQLKLSSSAFPEKLDYGQAFLKNYRLPGGPQNAFQLGFEYRDPAYWWFGASVNYFEKAFIDINPLLRTTNFQKDYDGLPLVEYDAEEARDLLQQEEFPGYFITNLIGGKSWRIKNKNLGMFVSINNLFDKFYKSGGFEQARNSNFRTLKEDRARKMPVFGNKYWFGQGTTFFANLNYRF